jgi:hypothetical protein
MDTETSSLAGTPTGLQPTSWASHLPDGRARCQAAAKTKSREAGYPVQCEQPAVTSRGRDKCYLHGGLSLPPGPAHPAYTHGRSSKYLPLGPIADAYAAMNAELAQVCNLTDDIAIVEGFRADALAGLAGADLSALAQTIDGIADALTSDMPITPADAAQQLRQAATKANDAQAAKRKAVQASHDKAKLIETELKRRAQMDKLVTRDQAIAFGFAIVDACKAKLPEDAGAWLADQAHRAAARFILGTDPDG